MRRLAAAVFPAALLLAASVQAAPTASLHEIHWFVHVDLIDAGAGRDLAFYQALLDAALEDARVVLEGDQGPADAVCCSRLEQAEHAPGVTLATFGTPGDGLDVQDAGDFASLGGIGGSGSRAFLIDSINDCGGATAIGCATLPACDGTPDDDPDLVMSVTLDAADEGLLGLVIAHERGHNACLGHVAANACQLMRAAISGGCLSLAECRDFDDARQTTGGSCETHSDAQEGDPVEDGIPCSDGGIVGLSSGGVCGATPGDASVQLFAAGGAGAATGVTTDHLLRHSAVPGGWRDVGSFGRTLRGLAYDADAGILYGIEDVAGDDDAVVVVDPETGATTDAHTVVGHPDLLALAFDPGASAGSGDDRLLALSNPGGIFEDLIVIDPTDGSSTTLGGLDVGIQDGFQGLAYDDVNDRLFASGYAGGSLWEIDDGCPIYCTTTEVAAVSLPRADSGLAFSRESGNLYLVGRQSGPRILYDTIDPVSFAVSTTIGIDDYTVGGLAALPVPEPAGAPAFAAGAALVAGLARRRRAWPPGSGPPDRPPQVHR